MTLAELNAGALKYTPATNDVSSPPGSIYASFGFRVRDNGGTAGGGVDLDPQPAVFNVVVTATPPSAERIPMPRPPTPTTTA